MTGVWMSDSSGFAVTPPRADSDATSVRPVEPPQAATGSMNGQPEPEGELMIARASRSSPLGRRGAAKAFRAASERTVPGTIGQTVT
jgi:hypothetical protein